MSIDSASPGPPVKAAAAGSGSRTSGLAGGEGAPSSHGGVRPNAPIDLNVSGDGAPRLSVVVPTRNEAHNIELLLGRLGPAVAALDAELVVVDDSDDQTCAVLAEAAMDCEVPVRLLHRSPGHRAGGLGSAVIAGA